MTTKAPVTLESIRKNNCDRQKRFYDAHKETLNAKRRARYALGNQALQAATTVPAPAPVVPATVHVPATTVPAPAPVPAPAARRRSARVAAQPVNVVAPAIVPAPVPALLSVRQQNNAAKAAKAAKISASVVLHELTEKPHGKKKIYGPQGKYGYADMSNAKSISYDQAAAHITKIITRAKTAKKQIADLRSGMEIAGITNLLDLKNTASIIKKFDDSDYAANSAKGYVEALIWCIDHFELGQIINKKPYVLLFSKLKVLSAQVRAIKEATPLKYTFPQYINKVIELYTKDSDMYVISKMYYDMPFRDDFGLVITNDYEKTQDDEDDTNWLYVPDPVAVKGKGTRKGAKATVMPNLIVVIHEYKTSATYGPVECEMSAELSSIVRAYMLKNKRVLGDFLFGRVHLTQVVSDANKLLGWNMGVGRFREMRIREFEDLGEFTPADRARIAAFMMHSVGTQQTYRHATAKEILVM